MSKKFITAPSSTRSKPDRVTLEVRLDANERQKFADHALAERQGLNTFVRQAVHEHIRPTETRSGPHERRTSQLKINVTAAERKAIKASAQADRSTLSSFARAVLLASVREVEVGGAN